MKTEKKNRTQKPRLSLHKETLGTLTPRDLEHVRGGLMPVIPRTDCICCKACATATC